MPIIPMYKIEETEGVVVATTESGTDHVYVRNAYRDYRDSVLINKDKISDVIAVLQKVAASIEEAEVLTAPEQNKEGAE